MTTYRCELCGSVTGHEMGEAQQEGMTNHGPGKCGGTCRYCDEGVMHAPQTCANVRPGEVYPTWVRMFIREHSGR